MKLTSRERVIKAINHEQPDLVPIDIGGTACNFTVNTLKRMKEYFSITSDDLVIFPNESGGLYNDELIDKMGGDFKHVFLAPNENYDIKINDDNTFCDEWGMLKKIVGGLTQQVSYPLAGKDISAIDSYKWPDPYEKSRIKGLRERAIHLFENTSYAISARAVSHGFFELSWEMRGFEDFLVDMMIDKPFANKLLNKVLDIQIGFYDALLSSVGDYVQLVQTGDDYGTQNGPIMSVELFREMIVPRRRILNDFIKSKAKNAKISHHTCGSVFAYIDDLIDTGVDILNPVQPLARDMDSFKIKETFGSRIGFHGSVDEQSALIGSIDELENEIKTRILAFAPGGGFIIAPTSNFQDDMPIENIISFVKFARKYGAAEFYT